MASKTPHERVRALLSKTLGNGATEEEEDASVRKALQLIEKDGLPIGDFLFPPGYGRDGRRMPTVEEEFERRHGHKLEEDPPPKPKPEPAKPEPVKRPEIIKQTCERLLLEITGRDKDGFTTGHAYEKILAMVKEVHPHGDTSIKCLRWYATHMRDQGCIMPQKRDRPAPKPRQPKAPEAAA